MAAVPTGTPIDFAAFLPGITKLLGGSGGSKSSSQSSASNTLSLAVSPQIVNGNPSNLSGPTAAAYGAPATTGAQTATLPSYLPGVSAPQGSYLYPSAVNPNLGYTTNNAGVATGVGSLLTSPVVLLALAGLGLFLAFGTGK